ncbi:MAG: hypothetical protein ACK5MG_01845 [Bacteroidales bacterium]
MFTIKPQTVSDEGVSYEWQVNFEEYSSQKRFEKILETTIR